MRIRKRLPPPPPPSPPPPPPPSASSSSPPPVTVTPPIAPDLPYKTPPDLQSQSLDAGDAGLPRLAHLSVLCTSTQSPPHPRDSSNPSLTQRPDLHTAITKGTKGWICAGTGRDVEPNCKAHSDCTSLHPIPASPTRYLQYSQFGAAVMDGGGGTGGKEAENKSLAPANSRIKDYSLGAATSVEISAPKSLSHQVVGGRWCEGERAFPLKKRRGSFERKLSDDTIMEKSKKLKTKMRTKVIAKKRAHEEHDEKHEEVQLGGREDGTVKSSGVKKEKRGRGGLIMEGCRCSRVNGRGWRCCQQTLVGYSLCEHHLGKGRLRSISSVRYPASTNPTTNGPKTAKEDQSGLLSSSLTSTTQCLKSLYKEPVESDDEEGEEDHEPLMNTKKRKKIGTVKARSIRSLLGQTNLAPPVTPTTIS